MTTQTSREKIAFRLSIAAAVIFLITSLVLVFAEAYVRWKLNKDFSFLSTGGLETLIASASFLILGLAFIHRPKNS